MEPPGSIGNNKTAPLRPHCLRCIKDNRPGIPAVLVRNNPHLELFSVIFKLLDRGCPKGIRSGKDDRRSKAGFKILSELSGGRCLSYAVNPQQ